MPAIYISEFTLCWQRLLVYFWKRLQILPFQLRERAYWPWLVFALPGLVFGWKIGLQSFTASGYGVICLECFGFLGISSTLAFSTLFKPQSPPPTSFLVPIPRVFDRIGLGKMARITKPWQIFESPLEFTVWRVIALLIQDWKMAGFQCTLTVPSFLRNQKFRRLVLGFFLLIPAMYSD